MINLLQQKVDIYHMFIGRLTWCNPPSKKPRDLLLCFGCQGIIIMARSYNQIKPLKMSPWMLYLIKYQM